MIYKILLLFFFFVLFLMIDNNPDFFFWLFITLLFDPTGHLTIYFNKTLFGGYNYVDIIFALSFLTLLSKKVSIMSIFNDKLFRKILIFSILFMLYKIIVHGLIIPEKNFSYMFRYQIIRERICVFGFLLIIPVYVMAKRNIRIFLNFIIFATVLPLMLYLITLLSNIDFVPVWSLERYRGIDSGIMRKSMLSTGLSLFTIPMATAIFFLRYNIKYRKLLYFSFMLTLLSIILTLSKGMYIYIFGLFLIVLLLMNKLIFQINLIHIIRKISLPLIMVLLLVLFTFPKYISHGKLIIKDIYGLVLKGGMLTEGRIEGRLVNQLPAHIYTIKKYPIFGTGLGRLYEQKEFDVSDYDVTDLSVTGHIAQFGLLGIIFYLRYYFIIAVLMKRVFRKIKRNLSSVLSNNNYEYIIGGIIATTYFINRFTFTIDGLFGELTKPGLNITVSLMVGVLLAVHSKFKLNS